LGACNLPEVTAARKPPELDGFELSVDRDAEVPIGVQLAWALRARIHDGRFKPGQRLPGLREVAAATGVNINTVRAVYQRLDQEGLIDSQQGSGTFVGPTPRRPPDVAAIVASAVREARETGVDPREVAAALYVSPEFSPPADTAGDRRRLLRAQIAGLEHALADIEAEHPGVGVAAPETKRGGGPTLLGAEDLERVRTELVRRLATVQDAIDKQVLAKDAESSSAPKKKPKRAAVAKPKPGRLPRAATRTAPAGGEF
jgi:DNA-binding transcriptional regulator YhcF (GntR family)